MTEFNIDQIRDQPDPQTRPEWDAVELLDQHFAATQYAVRPFMPEGAGLVTAAPKVGKSLFVRDAAMAVATGTPLWDTYETSKGKVLWLALEDGARRVQQRLSARGDTARMLRRGDITVRTVSKRLGAGGLDEIATWLDRTPDASLAVIDVFARVRDIDGARSSSVYADDYAALEPLQNLAAEHRVCLPTVHHNRKVRPGDDDPFESISGTQGLLGAVDWAIVLTRRRGDDVGELHATGRDIVDVHVALDFQHGLWSLSTMPLELAGKSKRVRELWRQLESVSEADTQKIAGWYGQSANATAHLLRRLSDEGLIDQIYPPAKGRPAMWQVIRFPPSNGGGGA